MRFTLVAIAVFWTAFVSAQDLGPDTPLECVAELPEIKSLRRALKDGQELYEAGDYCSAIAYLSLATQKFSAVSGEERKTLSVLYTDLGRSIFENPEMDESERLNRAEIEFMRALRADVQNQIASDYIDAIRTIKELSVSEGWSLFKEVAFDKAGDIAVFGLGFFFGSLLSTYVTAFRERQFSSKSRKMFMVGQYDDFADLLEIQLTENNLRPLRHSLSFMLEHKSLEESSEILSKYVNSEENLNTLLRMIRLSDA